MATSKITPDHDAVVTEIEIAAPPDRVFQAITRREQAVQWGGAKEFEIILWEDARPGGKWKFVSKDRSGENPTGLSLTANFSRLTRRGCWPDVVRELASRSFP
jgi:uncharacterized protein YndB with AHSA1/START domain